MNKIKNIGDSTLFQNRLAARQITKPKTENFFKRAFYAYVLWWSSRKGGKTGILFPLAKFLRIF